MSTIVGQVGGKKKAGKARYPLGFLLLGIVWMHTSVPAVQGGASLPVRKLSVEIPVLDDTASAAVELARDVARELDRRGIEEASTVLCSADAFARAQALGKGAFPGPIVDLSAAAASGQVLSGPLVLAAPTEASLPMLERLLGNWRGSVAVAVNATWPEDPVDKRLTALARSFACTYCFQPLSIQVRKGPPHVCEPCPPRCSHAFSAFLALPLPLLQFFLQRLEGVMIKSVEAGQLPEAAPWKVYAQEGPELRLIGQQKEQRPTAEDLELIFLNESAKKSPLTGMVRGLRDSVEKLKKGR